MVTLTAREGYAAVRQGGSVNITLDITRAGGPSGPITVAVPNPPAGLSGSSVTIEETASSATISLTATSTAALGGPVMLPIEGTYADGVAQVMLPALVFGPAGALDTTFGTSGSTIFTAAASNAYDYPRALVFQPDGKLVIAGVTTSGGYRFVLARLTENGVLDTGFAGGAGKTQLAVTIGGSTISHAHAVALDGQGRILIGGSSGATAAEQRWTIARYTAAGVLDTTFGNQTGQPGVMLLAEGASSGNEAISFIHVQSTGELVVIGSAASGGHRGLGIARITESGNGIDPTFNSGAIRRHTIDSAREVVIDTLGPFAVEVDSMGRFVFTGATSTTGDVPAVTSFVGRLLPSGDLDTQFTIKTVPTSAGTPEIRGLAVLADNSVVLAGYEAGTSNVLSFKYTGTGAVDTAFNGGQPLEIAGIGTGWDALETPEGLVLVGATESPAPVDMNVLRRTAAGAVDSSFGTGGAYTMHYSMGGGNSDLAIRVVRDQYGRLVVGGRRVPTSGSSWNFVFFRLFP
jgi:uncharacterized delta-60 repeat protein